MRSPTYSIIIPVYNEEGSLRELFQELLTVMTRLSAAYEILFVDDRSDDETPKILKEFQGALPEIVVIVTLLQRSGQTFALKQGLNLAKGRIVVTLDADLQNDPADIPRLIEKMNHGKFDCVCGWRKARQDTPLKAGMSKFGNMMQRMFTGMKIHDVSCTLRAYRRECVNRIAMNWEGQHRFMPLSLSLQGFKVDEIVSNHRKRRYGQTKYSHKRVFRVVKDFFRMLKTKGKS